MTAKRRARKFNHTRRNDDDPYTQRIRAASNAAKEARAAARRAGEAEDRKVGELREEGEDLAYSLYPDIEGLSIHEAELPEGVQALVVDTATLKGVAIRTNAAYGEEAVHSEAASDAASVGERGTSEAEGQPASEQGAEPQAPTFFEQLAAVRNLADEANGTNEEVEGPHKAFLEREVNGLPQHVGTNPCSCDIRKDHWIELGEN